MQDNIVQAGAVQDSTKQCRMAQVGWHKQDGAVRAVQDGAGQDRTRSALLVLHSR